MAIAKLLRATSALLLTFPLLAQITADVKGVVTDPAGASIDKAKITIRSKETGETRVLTGDAEGRFAANQLKIGLYSVQAEAAGFRTEVTDAILRSGETTVVNFRLEIGQVTESVTVTDVVSAIDTNDAQVQLSIEGAKIQTIAVNRNPVLFALTMPGVTPVTANNPFLGSGSYNSNGGRGRGKITLR